MSKFSDGFRVGYQQGFAAGRRDALTDARRYIEGATHADRMTEAAAERALLETLEKRAEGAQTEAASVGYSS